MIQLPTSHQKVLESIIDCNLDMDSIIKDVSISPFALNTILDDLIEHGYLTRKPKWI